MYRNECLIKEYRLIELMLRHIRTELDRIAETGKTDPLFVDIAVGIIRDYADGTHHKKEEPHDCAISAISASPMRTRI